ncbi:hypothetical protein TRFO_40884 [Tritrichomonas foetus]|uniref:Uncharacterized protein n=1 Tax=Tritrichomonas foetus TaxID=1144522 RepID=A0A1J4IZM8_9EUKA|nr:hypothetical protein TRFO_40884 [Tritrichomonas foetus]|eukprot:OHS92800.1 hypothetical protein TRFO_40884 [Tritrichomonas foetus]
MSEFEPSSFISTHLTEYINDCSFFGFNFVSKYPAELWPKFHANFYVTPLADVVHYSGQLNSVIVGCVCEVLSKSLFTISDLNLTWCKCHVTFPLEMNESVNTSGNIATNTGLFTYLNNAYSHNLNFAGSGINVSTSTYSNSSNINSLSDVLCPGALVMLNCPTIIQKPDITFHLTDKKQLIFIGRVPGFAMCERYGHHHSCSKYVDRSKNRLCHFHTIYYSLKLIGMKKIPMTHTELMVPRIYNAKKTNNSALMSSDISDISSTSNTSYE